MKYLLSLAFAFAIIQLAFGVCKHGSDCEENECCVVVTPMSQKGTCKKRPEDGEKCLSLTSTLKKNEGLYMFGCPCAEGLKCVTEGTIVKRHKCAAE